MKETSFKRGFRLSTSYQRRLDAARDDFRRADLDRPRTGNVPAIVGLVVLTAVTSWVVARVSVWLVPVYMSAMVLIFAAPRTSRPKGSASVPEGLATATGGGDEPTPDRDAPGSSVLPVVVEPSAGVDDVASVSPKPRKRRAKGKRSTRAAAEAEVDPASAQVTWIRVGPGKFVRADAQDSETEGSPPTVPPPEADATAEETPSDSPNLDDGTPGADDAPEEPGSFGLPEPPEAFEADAEEHGIAPSTLGEGEEVDDYLDEADCEDFQAEPVELPAAEPAAAAEAEPVATSFAPFAATSTPATTIEPSPRPTRPTVLLSPTTVKGDRLHPAGAVVAPGRLQNVRRGEAPRPATVLRRAADVRLRQRAGRIRGRRVHVQRDYHPRSPPARA